MQVLKLDSYNRNLLRIAPDFKVMYKDQIALEFIKADYDKFLDPSYFDANRWRLVQSFMNEYRSKENHIADLKREIQDLRNSHSYRVGHLLIAAPGRIKRLLQSYN